MTVFIIGLLSLAAVSEGKVNGRLNGAFGAFVLKYKQVCHSELVLVDDSGMAVEFRTLAHPDEELSVRFILAPIAAIHMCGGVEGSLTALSPAAVAFYRLVAEDSRWKVPSPVNALEEAELRLAAMTSEFGDLHLLDHLVQVLQFVRENAFNRLFPLYVVGFITANHTGWQGGSRQVWNQAVHKYLTSLVSPKNGVSRMTMSSIAHNFFFSVDPIRRHSRSSNRDYFEAVMRSCPHYPPSPPLAVVPPAAVPRAVAQSASAEKRLRLLIANDGKLWEKSPTLPLLMEFAEAEKADFVIISEGAVSSTNKVKTLGDFTLHLPRVETAEKESLKGGVGLAYHQRFSPNVNMLTSPTTSGFDIAGMHVADGIRLVGLYASPTGLTDMGRAMTALREWTKVAEVVMGREYLLPPAPGTGLTMVVDDGSLNSECIVAGDMNAASGTKQRLIIDLGMAAMNMRLLNPGMITYQKLGGAQKDLDLIFGSEGVLLADANVSRKYRTNDHERIIADLVFQERTNLPNYRFAAINPNADVSMCISFSCALDQAALQKDFKSKHDLAKIHVDDSLEKSAGQLGFRMPAESWTGQIYGAVKVNWSAATTAPLFSEESVASAVDDLFSSCISCHRLPANSPELKTLLWSNLQKSLASSHMVDELAAPVVEMILAKALKQSLDARTEKFAPELIQGCSSWTDVRDDDKEAEVFLALAARVASEESDQELFVASLNYPEFTPTLMRAGLSEIPVNPILLSDTIRTFLSVHSKQSFVLTRQLACLAFGKAVRESFPRHITVATKTVSDVAWAQGVLLFAQSEVDLKGKIRHYEAQLGLQADQVDIMSYPNVKTVRMAVGGVKLKTSTSLRLPAGLLLMQANPRVMVSQEKIDNIVGDWMAAKLFLADGARYHIQMFNYLVSTILADAMRGAEVAHSVHHEGYSEFSEMSNMILSSFGARSDVASDIEVVCHSAFKLHPSFLLHQRAGRLLVNAGSHDLYKDLFASLMRDAVGQNKDIASAHFFSALHRTVTLPLQLPGSLKKTKSKAALAKTLWMLEDTKTVAEKLEQFEKALETKISAQIEAALIHSKLSQVCADFKTVIFRPIAEHKVGKDALTANFLRLI